VLPTRTDSEKYVRIRVLAFLACCVCAPTSAAAQSAAWTVVATIPGAVDRIDGQGNFVYLAAGAVPRIVDVGKPEAPAIIASLTLPQPIRALTSSRSTIYAADDSSGLVIVDITNPRSPSLHGSYKTPGPATAVAVSNTKALVVAATAGLQTIDVSKPAAPVLLGAYPARGPVRDVVTTGSLGYAVSLPTGFSALDLSEPGAAVVISAQQTADAPFTLAIPPDDESGPGPGIACVIGGEGAQAGSLQIFDVSNPAVPLKVATLKTPGQAQRVAMKGTRASVADATAGLQVVDLSKPDAPMIVDSFKTSGPARDVAVRGALVFVATGGPSPALVILRKGA